MGKHHQYAHCTVEGCERAHAAKGFCAFHYHRNRYEPHIPLDADPTDKRDESNPNWRGGKTKHPLYDIYQDMVRRCTNPDHARWESYGGRGINVCQRWKDDFWAYVEDMGPRPEGKRNGRSIYSMDRVNNDGDYEPGNVVWATDTQQANNKRGFGPSIRSHITGQFVGSTS